jgi:hypothetical protein
VSRERPRKTVALELLADGRLLLTEDVARANIETSTGEPKTQRRLHRLEQRVRRIEDALIDAGIL